MKRRYRRTGFLERCRRLRQVLDQPAFTTDIIVGFPGESEEDFLATCSVVQEVGFSRIHVFSFSPREGTAAAGYPGRVSPQVIAERRRRLRNLEKSLAQAYFQSLAGRTLEVLVEGLDPARAGNVLGTSCRYAPVSFPGYAPALMGRLIQVRAEQVAEGLILGHAEPAGSSGLSSFPERSASNPLRIPLPQAFPF